MSSPVLDLLLLPPTVSACAISIQARLHAHSGNASTDQVSTTCLPFECHDSAT